MKNDETGSERNIEDDKYPRRQMVRKPWQSLNGNLDFTFDNEIKWEKPWQVPCWNLQIEVPFAPESEASGVGNTDFHSRCWYRKSFEVKKLRKRVILHFGAVDYFARVWINDDFVGSHEGGYTPFEFDITDLLRDSASQVVTVCADDDPHDLTKPRGKQDWQRHPHSIWYPRTSGIWQTVWVEEVGETYISNLRLTPKVMLWEIGCEVFVAGSICDELEVQVVLSSGGKILAKDRYAVINQEVHRRIALSDPGIDDFRNELLWSPEKPTLILAQIRLFCRDEVVDEVESYTALRSVSIDRGRFLLNGRPYYMRLVLDQGYWPETMLTPPSSTAIRQDIELTKAAGFNGVRKHQKIEDPEYLYWADRLGLLVWGEMPSAYRFTHESVERLTQQWTEAIDRDMNHPCIVVWVPFNESWGVPDLAEKVSHQNCVQALYHLTKTLDPTRPVIGNDGWESVATDILGIHDYDDQSDRLFKKYSGGPVSAQLLDRYRPGGRVLTVAGYPLSGQPLMLTEFGGINCVEASLVEDGWGYSVCQTPDEFRRRYEVLLATVNRIESFIGFCYTQFVDTFQESNGLFNFRREPKFSLAAMARATRGSGYTRGELLSVPEPPQLLPFESPESLDHL